MGVLLRGPRALLGVFPLPLQWGRMLRPLRPLLRESSASRSIFILETESPSKSLPRVSTRDPPGGVSRWIFLSASSKAVWVASAAPLSTSSWARAESCARFCCSWASSASWALISASVLAFSSATFIRAVLMASRLAVSA